MSQETQDGRHQLQPENWEARVRHFLQHRGAVRVKEIAEWLGVEEAVVRYCLARFEQSGQVEVLRPIGREPGPLPDLDYYRWRLADDHRFRWQTELHRHRMATLRELHITLAGPC